LIFLVVDGIIDESHPLSALRAQVREAVLPTTKSFEYRYREEDVLDKLSELAKEPANNWLTAVLEREELQQVALSKLMPALVKRPRLMITSGDLSSLRVTIGNRANTDGERRKRSRPRRGYYNRPLNFRY
jgi:hypothetical protein